MALTIAGSDSSGGAGIQADLKTFSLFGVAGATAITALTAQNARSVHGVLPTPAGFVSAQIEAVCSHSAIAAVKTGMLPNAAIIAAAATGLERFRLSRFILDPVMIATSGAELVDPSAMSAIRDRLIPLAELVTPNLPEAARLLDAQPAASPAAMEAQARLFQSRCGAHAVLIKGGHGHGATAIDVLVPALDAPAMILELPRLATTASHGTGCTLSAAIAALRALDVPLPEAVRRAKLFVWRALASGAGNDNGALDHLFAISPDDPPA